ncbi:hypothetical protein [Novipirellula sp.]|uniref:hypothetical protein n=1 Tax=Novipirellula sp. TaxID=2795430 RepID=UPI003565383E
MLRLSLFFVVLLLSPAFGEDGDIRSDAESTPSKANAPQVAPTSFPFFAPLSASEKRFVGQWQQTILPTNEPGPVSEFASDRTFRSDSGLAGRWWVRDEQLHIQYWTDKQSVLPFADLLRGWQAEKHTWNTTFNDEGDRVELALPNKTPEAVLTRISDEAKRSIADPPSTPADQTRDE